MDPGQGEASTPPAPADLPGPLWIERAGTWLRRWRQDCEVHAQRFGLRPTIPGGDTLTETQRDELEALGYTAE